MSEFVTHKEHAKELKEYKQVIDDERHDWIKERIQPGFLRFEEWISKNDKELALLKQNHITMSENIREMKKELKEGISEIKHIIEKQAETFATKAEHKENQTKINWIIKIIWTFWVAIILWWGAFIWDFITMK